MTLETPHERKFALRMLLISFAAIVLIAILAFLALGLGHHNTYPQPNSGNHASSQQ